MKKRFLLAGIPAGCVLAVSEGCGMAQDESGATLMTVVNTYGAPSYPMPTVTATQIPPARPIQHQRSKRMILRPGSVLVVDRMMCAR
jgi:D-serine deaminase-like pyridoxal phosphate-dependent protein